MGPPCHSLAQATPQLDHTVPVISVLSCTQLPASACPSPAPAVPSVTVQPLSLSPYSLCGRSCHNPDLPLPCVTNRNKTTLLIVVKVSPPQKYVISYLFIHDGHWSMLST